jgi:hypothetical protein
MKARGLVFGVSILLIVEAGLSLPSSAFDLAGAWTTEKSVCPQVFKKNATSIVFTSDSEMWGRGFIVEGSTIRGQTVKCTIKSKKETESDINLIASCATDIMIDQIQLSFKKTGDDSITREFPGMPGSESSFVRCSF